MATPPREPYVVNAISCGRDHTLALLAEGKVFGWGGEGSGRVPAGTPQYCSTSKAPTTAIEVILRHPLIGVAAGYGVSLGITATEQVAVWGASAAGIGGRLDAVQPATPQMVVDIADAHAVVAGEFQFGAIDRAGVIHTWGLNHEGALGRPTEALNALPGVVTTVPPASQLVSGKGYMVALTRAGALYAWGDNAAGQLGLGHLQSVLIPSLLPLRAHTQVRAIAAGATHTMAVTANGDVLAWGSNHRGQLGHRELPYSATPVPVLLPEPVRSVAAGMHFSLALAESGNVYAWGWNGQGQLGLNDTHDRRVPQRIPDLAHVVSIAAGQTHAAALTAWGISGWGNNAAGQLGTANRLQLHPTPFFVFS